ncbi:uncharacterized protein LOC110691163 [Chenopodium quinoa]|uniref:uncharacterized protein LOC110691163 n=1 Tax=Chenopodium quinoa TaxID=63459 RepID=UPI000B794A5A|nr:uncharacterized protein LOC110691163 [Chenopodium quinoa]
MGDLMKRKFSILDLTGKKFLEWKVDAMMNLKAQGLEHTVKENKSPFGQTTDATFSVMTVVKPITEQDKAKALVLLRYHLHEGLKTEYMMDFKSVIDYNSTIHEIVSILRYCDHPITDEHMLEKTLTTFHASNILSQEQYRERGFKKFNELMSVLLITEQNSELLLKNHNLRPTGSLATHHEANATNFYPPESNATRRGGRGNTMAVEEAVEINADAAVVVVDKIFKETASIKGKEKNAEAYYVNEEN